MGFFDGFKEGLKDKKTERENREIVRLYHEQHELDSDYRSKAFDNAESNGGWYTCAKCGRKFRKKDIDIDHINPRSKGGNNSRYNLQILCSHCNRSKGANMSDTYEDMARRREEIRRQDREDVEFLNRISKNRRK